MIIGPNGENPEDIPFLIEAFRRLVDTAGVGIADIKPEKRVQWLVELTRFLSHDEPIDVSLFAACRQVQSPPPFLSASRQLVEFSRLSESVKSFGKKLLKMEFDEGVEIPGLEIDGEDAWNFGMNEGIHHLKKIGDEFFSTVHRFRFDQESTSATSFSKIKKQFEEIQARDEKSKKNQTRWIQAQVYDLTDRPEQTDLEREPQASGARNRLTRALRANAPHEILVRIGPDSETWIQNDEEFKPEDITVERESHELTVVFTEPQLFNEPQVALITLPPRGASSLCSFPFHVGESIRKIEGRISIIYKNRVLQTALLRADVTAFPERESENRQISLSREVVIRADFEGLNGRRNFDAAFILNEDINNRSSFTAIRNEYVSFTDLEWLKGYTDEIDRRLRSITEFPDAFTNGLDSPATVDLMSVLAKTGWLMYKTLSDFQDGTSPLANIMVGLTNSLTSKAGHQRIQIISAKPETRLPFEFIYDRTPPSGTKVKLCPKVMEALEQGHCFTDCPGVNQPENHVCPLGFWGLSKVIERHNHNILYTPEEVHGKFRFQSEPAKERPHLQAFKKALFAASDRADVIAVDANGREKKGGLKQVLSVLNKLTNSKVQRISSWEDWCQKISADTPSILVLLTHTEKTAQGFLGLEIKDGKNPDMTLLEIASINRKHVSFPEDNFPPPIVLLIGCETGKADKIEFMDFVTMFRQSGAGIIVSTGIPIYGWDAVSLTNELLIQLKDIAAKQETSFGEIMRLLKQKMMARGFPVVLTLMAYGDADWKIGA